MKANAKLFFSAALLFVCGSIVFGQNANDYRTKASGNWSALSTWERFSGLAWEAATTAPDFSVGEISIDSSFTVTITADLSLDSVAVHAGGHVVINSGVTVTIPFNNGMFGIDVDTLGMVTVNGKILCQGSVGGAIQSIVFNDGSVYEHARNRGSAPRALWNTGSTILLTGVRDTSLSNMSQNFYNLTINCDSLRSNLNLGMSGNTIGGNITVIKTGATSRYYLTSPTAYSAPITILGDVIVTGGTFSTNGTSTATSIVVHTYGDIKVSGGNFGCSRGSAPTVSWYLYGDSILVSNATLQNSTSSATAIQKFIFAKQGIQHLAFSNVSYGASGTSPITYQVSSGTTLDIDTSYLQGPLPPSISGSTGSFILDSGATLVSRHNGEANDGSIECTADYGGGNSFLNITATAGTGMTTVKAFKGPHPNSYDTSKSLHRYYNVTAGAGITEAAMTFYYFDTPIAPVSEVRGTETNYKALHYAGSGDDWYTVTSSSDDDVFDFVTALGIASISGDWTLGETTPAVAGPTSILSESEIDFGVVKINSSKKDTVRISNLGNQALQISQITSSNPKFTVSALTSVVATGSGIIEITFTPTAVADETGQITLTHNAPGGQSVISVSGKGDPLTSVKNNNVAYPAEFFLGQNFPNPFNPSTTIAYGLPKDEFVSVRLYNLVGQEIAVLFEGGQHAGYHELKFNAGRLNSGVYFYKIHAGNFRDVKRMLLLK